MANPVYATADEFKSYLQRSGDVNHGDDAMINSLLSAAEYKTDSFCNREDTGFLASDTATIKTYVGNGTGVCWIDECVEVTAVAVKTSSTETSYASWASTDWQSASGYPEEANFNRTPYTFLTITPWGSESAFTSGKHGRYSGPTVQVTAKWGYAASGSRVLDLVKDAVIAQAMRWHARLGSKMADTIAGPEFSTLLYRQALDPEIKDMLVNGNLVRDANAMGVIL